MRTLNDGPQPDPIGLLDDFCIARENATVEQDHTDGKFLRGIRTQCTYYMRKQCIPLMETRVRAAFGDSGAFAKEVSYNSYSRYASQSYKECLAFWEQTALLQLRISTWTVLLTSGFVLDRHYAPHVFCVILLTIPHTN